MTIVIVKRTEEGLEIGADSGAWRGESFIDNFNKIIVIDNIILAGAGYWNTVRTFEGFIKSKTDIVLNNIIDVLKLIDEFLKLLPNKPSSENLADFTLYDRNTNKLFIVDDLTYAVEYVEEDPYIFGSCHDMAFVLLKEGNGIKETIEKCIKYSTEVGGHVNYQFFEKK